MQLFAIFASGFILRPLGTLVFGHRIKTFRAIRASLAVVAVPTLLMGCVPSWNDIGVASPLIFLLLRLIQSLTGKFEGNSYHWYHHVEVSNPRSTIIGIDFYSRH